MNNLIKAAVVSLSVLASVSGAQAQTIGGILGSPVIAVGNLLGGVAAIHHQQLAPTVNGLVPNVGPVTDGVTNAIGAIGSGVAQTGGSVQNSGLVVGSNPATGAPLVSVGATSTTTQGSLVALLNGQ